MEVDGVLLEQVRPHEHADVSEGKEEFVILIYRKQWRRNVAVHYSNICDLAGIHVSIKKAVVIRVGDQSHGAVKVKTDGHGVGAAARPNTRGWVTGRQRARRQHIEFEREIGTGLAVRDLGEPRQRS